MSGFVRKVMSAFIAVALVGVLVPVSALGAVADLALGTTRALTPRSDLAYGAFLDSTLSSVSDDGRFVAFVSDSTDLIKGLVGRQIYVYDREQKTMVLASVASNGAPADGYQDFPAISGNGRYVAFESSALNLAPGVTVRNRSVYRHDLQTGETILVSSALDGTQGNGHSKEPAISDDGNRIAWFSLSSNLVAGDTNNQDDVFVRDISAGVTTRVSVGSDGTQGNAWSVYPAISGDGKFVAFESWASNLVTGDSNDVTDVFVHNLTTGTTERASINDEGSQVSGYSYNASLSDDGSRLAFESSAANVVAEDNNSSADVFVRDREAGTTTGVSCVGNKDSEYPSISGNGEWVSFSSDAGNLVEGDTNNARDVFVAHIADGTVTRVSVAEDGTQSPTTNGYKRSPLSDDGALLVFDASGAVGLLPGKAPRSASYQVMVADTPAGTADRVSVSDCLTDPYKGWAPDAEVPALSGNQRYVVFRTEEPYVAGDQNLGTDIYRYDLTTDAYELVSVTPAGRAGNNTSGDSEIAVSYDGRYVAFSSFAADLVSNDTNNKQDVFLRDIQSGVTTRISVGHDESGAEWQARWEFSHPSISADGRYVTFQGADGIHLTTPPATYSRAQVFLYDRLAPAGSSVRNVSEGAGGWNTSDTFGEGVNQAKISADGKWVLLRTKATIDLPAAAATRTSANLYLRSLTTGETTRVGHTPDGGYPGGDISKTSISADGSYVAFQCQADGLVVGDSNGLDDIFVWSRQTGDITLVTHGPEGESTDDCSSHPSISPDGTWIAYQSWASNLTGEALDNDKKLYLYSVEDDESAIMDVLPGMWSQRVSLAVDNAGNAGLAFAASSTDYDRYGAGDSAGDCDGVYYAPLTLPSGDATPPKAPAGLLAKAISSTEIELTWNAATDPSGIATYTVYTAAGVKVADVTDATAYTVGDLAPNTTYGFKVTATDGMGNESDFTATDSAITWRDTAAPAAPGGLSVRTISPNRIELAWDAVTDLTGIAKYTVYTASGVKVADVTGDTRYLVDGLTPNTTYGFKLTATDGAGNVSGHSATASATTFPAPAAPTGVTATAVSPSAITLEWDALKGAAEYRIYNWYGGLVGTTEDTSYTVTGLQPTTRYAYWVRAVDNSGNIGAGSQAAWATTPAVPDTTAPAAPVVSVSVVSPYELALSWAAVSDPSGIARYTVYTAAGEKIADVTSGTSFSWKSLTPATRYSFYVTATDGAGNVSARSAVVSGTTASLPPAPPAPVLASVYRFYNVKTGSHFYTSSTAERDEVIAKYPALYTYEGVAYAIDATNSTVPLYRFYNKLTGTHFYTVSEEEKARVIATLASTYTYEGVAYNVFGAPGEGRLSVYRFYNIANGTHFYTTSTLERDLTRSNRPSFVYEGVAYYVAQ